MRIDYLPVGELRPYPNNPRMHSKRQVQQIANSVKKFGFCNPILIDESKQVLAGHGRLQAAQLLGLEVVPTCQLAQLSEAEKRAYVLADNKLAQQGRWDKEVLAIELQGLIALDFEVEVTGFEIPEINLILGDAHNEGGRADNRRRRAVRKEDAALQLSSGPAVSRPGDVWIVGKHRLLCGDACDQTSYETLLEGAKADFVFTDPLRNACFEAKLAAGMQTAQRYSAVKAGCPDKIELTKGLDALFGRLIENTIDGSIHHICMDWRYMDPMLAAGRKLYTELMNVCVWTKAPSGTGSLYRSDHELIFVWKSGRAAHMNNVNNKRGGVRSNVWDYAGVYLMQVASAEEEMRVPTTVKPVALVADAIKDCSRHRGLVLDPFCGSGTALIAAERTGHHARALERDPHYVDVAVQRWQNYTGKTALLAGSGETFAVTAEQRTPSAAAA